MFFSKRNTNNDNKKAIISEDKKTIKDFNIISDDGTNIPIAYDRNNKIVCWDLNSVDSRYQNLLLLGGTGMGKSTTALTIMDGLTRFINDHDNVLFGIDPLNVEYHTFYPIFARVLFNIYDAEQFESFVREVEERLQPFHRREGDELYSQPVIVFIENVEEIAGIKTTPDMDGDTVVKYKSIMHWYRRLLELTSEYRNLHLVFIMQSLIEDAIPQDIIDHSLVYIYGQRDLAQNLVEFQSLGTTEFKKVRANVIGEGIIKKSENDIVVRGLYPTSEFIDWFYRGKFRKEGIEYEQ